MYLMYYILLWSHTKKSAGNLPADKLVCDSPGLFARKESCPVEASVCSACYTDSHLCVMAVQKICAMSRGCHPGTHDFFRVICFADGKVFTKPRVGCLVKNGFDIAPVRTNMSEMNAGLEVEDTAEFTDLVSELF